MGLETLSTNPALNTARWVEGMAPNLVNDSARADNADMAAWYRDADWVEYGDGTGAGFATYVSSTAFRLTGVDLTTVYVESRRVRAVGTGTGTIYGAISGSVYTDGNTDVTVSWDSGSLSNEALRIYLGDDPAAVPVPVPTIAMSAQLAPISWIPETADKAFWNVFSDSPYVQEGMGVAASISTDAIWQLVFMLPVSLPSGTAKLQLIAIANATSGSAKVNPKWNVAGEGERPGTLTLNAEGTTTVTWSSGDANEYRVVKITLDASTATAGKLLVMRLYFETSGWTLAVPSTWLPFVIWE